MSRIDNSDSWSQYSFAPCSPCSSGSTCIYNGSVPAGQSLTIMLPNLIQRFSVTISEIEAFVSNRSHRPVEVTISHLLLYLFATSADPNVEHINNIKLLHRGRPYRIHRVSDLHEKLPSLADVAEQAPTFQLMITPHACSPLKMTVDAMLLKLASTAENTPASSVSVTYAEAMVKLFRNTTRKSSISSVESRATRYASRDSGTDVEEETPRAKHKFKDSVKRIFRSHNSRSSEFVTNAIMLSL
ncbi:hypothetical protein OXX59_005216 [Metschnikowia pulcherrima]